MNRIRDLLRTRLSDFEISIYREFLTQLERTYRKQKKSKKKTVPVKSLTLFLRATTQQRIETLREVRSDYLDFNRYILQAHTGEEKSQHVLTFAARLGSSGHNLRADKKALKKWFGVDALNDRFEIRIQSLERELAFLLGRLGALAGEAIRAEYTITGEGVALWKTFALEELLQGLFIHDGDSRVPRAAFCALSDALQSLPAIDCEKAVLPTTLQYIYRASLHTSLDIWLQREALRLLTAIAPESSRSVLRRRLEHPTNGDDFIVRAEATSLLGVLLALFPEDSDLLDSLLSDPSPFVRQHIVPVLATIPEREKRQRIEQLVFHDSCSQVRASALVSLLSEKTLLPPADIAHVLCTVMTTEQDTFVLRTACHLAEQLVTEHHTGHYFDRWAEDLEESLRTMQATAEQTALRRYAAQAAEAIWCMSTPEASSLHAVLAPRLHQLKRGKSVLVHHSPNSAWDEGLLGRVLAYISRHDFGFDVERCIGGYRITKDATPCFRLWRALHELWTSAPDKREPFCHTRGRLFFGHLQAPSTLMAELTETRVPGEPLFLSEEQGWRPYIPLTDIIMSSFNRTFGSRETKIYTAEGVTTITTPGLISGFPAYLTFLWKFADFAKKRNWRAQGGDQKPDTYVRSLERIGLSVVFTSHKARNETKPQKDTHVEQFFQFAPAGLHLLPEDLWGEFFSILHLTSCQYDNASHLLHHCSTRALLNRASCSLTLHKTSASSHSSCHWRLGHTGKIGD